MKAEMVHRSKSVLSDGAIIEMVIWRVPEPVAGSLHSFKYRLFYGRDGVRIVGFDNERQKGDNCHLDGVETTYRFTSVDRLVDDFLAHVKRRRK
ncbi:hypothetical protein BJF93_08125 [Xaviernesmea oryzae]|uniref:Uncharacterized protein n=2 Tax=Xaviernesmea oryzae TaxID=464029 RepID=A0A1Q9B184_9HYPH|nr:hypothetical protein BJF93_08125 [Xaviernesmea oryzae]